MSTVGGGVNIVKDGLVLYLDAANDKSLADVPSTNLATYSEQFDLWTLQQMTVATNSTTSPNGSSTADTITGDGTSGIHFVAFSCGVTTNISYTMSVFAKKGTNNFIQIYAAAALFGANSYANFDLNTGTIGTIGSTATASITNFQNGWYRCSITSTAISTANSYTLVISLINSTSSVRGETNTLNTNAYLWGGQFEVGPVATTYIPTTAASASRVPVWSDVSKGGNNGTLTSGFTYNYSNGGSLVFDGVSNYVTIPNSDNIVFGNGDFTANVWIKFPLSSTGEGGAWGPILSKGCNTAAPAGTWWIAQTTSLTNRVSLNISSTTGGTFVTSLQSNDFSDGWHNICVTRNGATSFMYSDGILIRTDTTSESNLSSIKPLTIGATFITGITTQRTNTSMGITQLYNRALSEQEIQQNFNATKNRFGL